jgi:hypothetical protein
MKRFFCALLFFSIGLSFADTTYLVSREEMQASNEAPLQMTPRTSPVKDAPRIELITPKVPGTVGSPTVIDLRFQATTPGDIKPESFKALYGTFQIDITKRLLSVAKVTGSGVRVEEASLPKGRHKLLLVVEDSLGRTGNQTVEFEVN